jgi:hypothetical protein
MTAAPTDQLRDGVGWSLGVITLVVGHLTIYSVMFVSIVIGIGTDYGIYVLFRYREARGFGRNVVDALEHTAARSGPGILLEALAEAGAEDTEELAHFAQGQPRVRLVAAGAHGYGASSP